MHEASELTITVAQTVRVSAVWQAPAQPVAIFVFAHGAGAGMTHPFMASLCDEVCQLGIATLRYQFPYMEQGSKRPDAPALCYATVRAAVLEATRLAPQLPLFAGGKSFGGRMTSQAQAIDPLPGVRGLIFVGFPLHPASKPDNKRARHLSQITIPMLFLQGDRDALASMSLLRPMASGLGTLATLAVMEHADHSFHVPVKSGRTDSQLRKDMAGSIARWIEKLF